VLSKSIVFVHEMLAHLIVTKHKEGWLINECAYAVDLVAKDWDLHRVIQFFGYFYLHHVSVTKKDLPSPNGAKAGPNGMPAGPTDDGKWTPTEMGKLIGTSMDMKDYSFLVDLLIKMVIGGDRHKTVFDSISSGSEAVQHFAAITKIYGVTLAHFPRWDFPFLGVAIRELANVPPKFAKHYYKWCTDELAMDFAVGVLINTAKELQKVENSSRLNSRFMSNGVESATEMWNEDDVDKFLGKVYAIVDGNDNILTYYAYKFLRFLRIKK